MATIRAFIYVDAPAPRRAAHESIHHYGQLVSRLLTSDQRFSIEARLSKKALVEAYKRLVEMLKRQIPMTGSAHARLEVSDKYGVIELAKFNGRPDAYRKASDGHSWTPDGGVWTVTTRAKELLQLPSEVRAGASWKEGTPEFLRELHKANR